MRQRSQLVREATCDGAACNQEQRRKAMQQFVGSRRSSPKDIDSTKRIRALRRGSRLERLLPS